ncbi:MAG: hypothetical protein V4512_06850 [Pseudomonadota bacterium]
MMTDIPASWIALTRTLNETVPVRCKRQGCNEIIHVRYDYLSSSGWWDLDCPSNHCELYDSPKDLRVLMPFYERHKAMREKIEEENAKADEQFYAECNFY